MNDRAQLASLSSGAPSIAWERLIELPVGFEWGAAKIERLFSDKKEGWVTIGLSTPKAELQIYVTKTGKVRIHSADGREWKPGAE
jgi:hypothetical protein